MVDSYPEYLNPFAEDVKPKAKLTIRNSFRELKRSLRQSFRIKKKTEGEVTLRQKPVLTGTLQRNPISYPSSQTEALPRSRFRERLSHSPGANPFEEEDREAKATIRRKGKKRAPLPPKSISSQHINDDMSEVTGDSRWSLTSVDTDCSGLVYEQQSEVKRDSIVDKFIAFNNDMKTLKDDTNNNVVSEEVRHNTESNSNIPDLVVSCPSETDKDEEPCLQTNDNQETEVHTKNEESESKDETPQTADTKNEEAENKDETENVNESPQKDNKNSDDSDEEEIIVKDITNNLISEENKINDAQINDPYLYNEKQSLYIAGSKDDLNEPDNYTGRVSLYITGSCDDLDASNNNEVCNKIVTDENSNDDAVPTPKQRKNKLSKNILLGV